MRVKILSLLEENGQMSAKDIAKKLGLEENEVSLEIEKMKDEGIICGYSAIVNWDKTDRRFVTALIEVKVTPQRGDGFDRIADRILRFPEVKSVYLMSGGFDLTVIVEGRDIKEVAFFVSDKLATIDAVIATSTHFVLKNYKDHSVIMGKSKKSDERMMVSP